MPGIKKTMEEFKTGSLHSGSKKGPKVTSRKQAIAIGLSEARKAGDSQSHSYDFRKQRGRRAPARMKVSSTPGVLGSDSRN